MRHELADVLDSLRNGESVTVTQRGKPDLILKKPQTLNPQNRTGDFLILSLSKGLALSQVRPTIWQ